MRIRHAHLLGKDGNFSINLERGRIRSVDPEKAMEEDPWPVQEGDLDAESNLVTPAFVDPHFHLDKSFLAEIPGETVGMIPQVVADLNRYATGEALEMLHRRMLRSVRCALMWGSTAIRGFADVSPQLGLSHVDALIALREELRPWIDLQVVAFPQQGIVRMPGTETLLAQAMEHGADVVGGIPWIETSQAAVNAHLNVLFDLAERFDADLHVVADNTDDPDSHTLESLCRYTIERGWQGRVSASQCEALAAYDDAYAELVIQLLCQANVAVVSNPHVTLVTSGRNDRGLVRRGLPRIKEMLREGICVACGQDDLADPFYPFGAPNQAQTALFMAHAAHLTTLDEIEAVWKMVTDRAAQLMHLQAYGIFSGGRGDLVIHRGSNPARVLAEGLPPQYVIRAGQVVVTHKLTTALAPFFPQSV